MLAAAGTVGGCVARGGGGGNVRAEVKCVWGSRAVRGCVLVPWTSVHSCTHTIDGDTWNHGFGGRRGC